MGHYHLLNGILHNDDIMGRIPAMIIIINNNGRWPLGIKIWVIGVQKIQANLVNKCPLNHN